jgi:hypothetical protein
MEFGCPTCFGDDAKRVLNNRTVVDVISSCVDESHFWVTLIRCRACRQLFAAVFCETVDMIGGNDPQGHLLVPLTPDEATTLNADDSYAVECALVALAPRRHVCSYWPSSAPQAEVSWLEGRIIMPPHD